MRGHGEFQTDPHCRPRQNGRHRFTALFGFEIHAGQFDFAQHAMHLHNALKYAFGRIVACGGFHLCENIKVHSTGEIFFPAGDDDPFDGLIAQCVIHQCVKMQERLHIQHVHGFAGAIPCDGGDALAVFGHFKIG